MRILIVSPYFLPAYRYGGPPRATHTLARALIERGHHVLVLTDNGNAHEELDVPAGVDTVFDGVPVRYLQRIHRGSYHFVPGLIPTLRRESPHFDVALVRGHWNFFNLASSLVLPRYNLPYILYPDGMLNKYARSLKPVRKLLYWRLVEQRNYSRAAGVIALTESEADEVRAIGYKGPIAVIPHGVPSMAAKQIPLVTNSRSKRILFVGRVHPIKGLDNLISAFVLVRRKHPLAELVIVGPVDDHQYARHLQDLITREDLLGHVTFTGLLTGESLENEYARASVFVLPSHAEAMGIAALEALAAGVPVIISRECSLPWVESYGAGLVSDASPPALARAIVRILSNPDEAGDMGEAGRRLASEQFSALRCADATVAFCEKVVQSQSPKHGFEDQTRIAGPDTGGSRASE